LEQTGERIPLRHYSNTPFDYLMPIQLDSPELYPNQSLPKFYIFAVDRAGFLWFQNSKTHKNKGIIAMKQKYLIIKDREKKQIKIQEYAELNKEMLSLLCEEAYDYITIKAALSAGSETLISALRTPNLYPPGIYAEKIASAVAELFKSKDQESMELFFDDANLLSKNRGAAKIIEQFEDEPAETDETLEDDFEDPFDDKENLNKMDSPIKAADDEFSEADDGS